MATRKDRIMNKLNKTEGFIKVTDISTIYSRSFDFNDHEIIFDYKNEYSNSLGYVQLNGTEEICSLIEKQKTSNKKSNTCANSSIDVNEKDLSKKRVRKIVNIGLDSSPEYIISNMSSASMLYCDEVLPPTVDNNEQDSPSSNEPDPYANSDDSTRDADYLPNEEDESAISDDDVVSTKEPSENLPVSKLERSREPVSQHCEFVGCKLHVFACCANCFCLLCSTHYDFCTPFNDCKNHKPYSTENYTEKFKSSKRNGKSKFDKKLKKGKEKNNNEKGLEIQVPITETNSNVSNQCCEYKNCLQEVFSACGKCLCLLCADHFHEETSYNDCTQHKPYTQSLRCARQTNLVMEKAFRCEHENTPDMTNINKIGLTKDGKVRQRRKFVESVQERKAKKIKIQTEKFDIKKPRSEKCIKKCTSNFSEEQRVNIHKEYISLSWESKGLFMKSLVETKTVATRKTNTKSRQDGTARREVSYKYFLYLDKEKIEVCKTFFLTTLGYNHKNDRRLHLALKRPADRQKDGRGKGLGVNVIDKNIIKADIQSYKPDISHYRREHAPLRLYLPSDVTITSMYEKFCQNHPHLKVSYEMYRIVLRKDMNISFAHLGNEECEVCAHFKQHTSESQNDSQTSCLCCQKYEKHKLSYQSSRKEYQKDVKNSSEAKTNTCFYSVDLQKVIMLPRMEQFKTGIFCPRIIVYNESFVPLGSSKNDDIPFPVVWHECISGRKQEDIISAMRAFLLYKRDKRHIILWMDNCSAQNKNWAVLSFLVQIINSNLISAETITLKYFEPGHTFMSADSYHHRVEQSMQKKGKIYDFDDFLDAVKNAQKPSEVKVMTVSDFYDYTDLSSQHRIRKLTPRIYLRDMMAIEAKKGVYTLDFKTDHDQDVSETLNFIQIKYTKLSNFPEVKRRSIPRGIKESTKTAIKERLLHLMPESRRHFWLDLPINTDDEDDDLKM